MKYVIFFLTFIITFNFLLASVQIQNVCKAEVKVTKIEPKNGWEWMKFTVTSKSKKGSSGDSCDFVHKGKEYTSLVKKVYRGKFLHVPPLRPGMLSVGDTFKASVVHNDGSKQMHWIFEDNNLGIPKETSFLSDYSFLQ